MTTIYEILKPAGALSYMKLFRKIEEEKNEFKCEKVQESVIAKDKFQTLYKTKDINSYVSFFEKHY